MPKGEHLSLKQKKFIKKYMETGNGTQAVIEAGYDVKNRKVAQSIATENLSKPVVIKSMLEAFPDDLLAEHHYGLFKQKQIQYFTFPKSMPDEEIVEHVNANGIEVITVRESDKGKMAFYSIPDANAIRNGLDMAYKIKGSYAPVKGDITSDGERIVFAPIAVIDRLKTNEETARTTPETNGSNQLP